MYKILFYSLMVVLLGGCNIENSKTDMFSGKELHIGVIGDIPEVFEKNIEFETISLKALKNRTNSLSKKFDAIFIMPKFLSDAANDQYVESYKRLTIPTFFIQSTKAHVPFVNKDVTYDSAPTSTIGGPNDYATGYLFTGSPKEYSDETWRYAMTEGANKEMEIKNVYSRIFKTIDSGIVSFHPEGEKIKR
ncbi:hypothetical protein M2M59_01180 [Rummeliibacillus sp. G93]|uniref:hypothetical protein n=1 Tax=Rummeliibacillus sp. G93 TaxID=2939494 RepID=UPI00201BD0C8|nr:hypothetical protein [Rummeliibacillus sp. G93]UQW97648.1 hypothetical protein M2M59_01180 [Rummeliibacillus sp. G93]